MNDRNRFRVWDNDLNQYITDTFEVAIKNNGELINHKGDPIKNCIVEHCTGLPAAKSYRGTTPEDLLIWEGDIVGGSNGSINGVEWPYKMTIKSIPGGFFFPEWAYDKDGNYHGDSTHYVKIIGNVHEVEG